MIITCPACDTKFMLSANAMGEQGREVRCAKCSHQWHAMPNQQPAPRAQEAPFVEPQISSPEMPPELVPEDDFDIAQVEAMVQSLAQHGKKKSAAPGPQPVWKMTAAFLLLACALTLTMAMRESLQPVLAPAYRWVGYDAEEGIALADVSLQALPTAPKENPRYDILCTILNQSKQARVIPPLSMKILNNEGVVLAEDDDFLKNSGDTLEPGKSATCKGLRFANPFSTATHLVIDLGSPLELSLRSDWEAPVEEEEEAPAEEDTHG